jgi:hypothetical protein
MSGIQSVILGRDEKLRRVRGADSREYFSASVMHVLSSLPFLLTTTASV